MFISNNRASFHLWWIENLVKYQKVSKYYENDCGQTSAIELFTKMVKSVNYLIIELIQLLVKFQTSMVLCSRFIMDKSSQQRCPIKKVVLKNFATFVGKHLCWSLFLIKLQACNFIKKRLQHRDFPVNIAKFLRTPFLQNICQRPHLYGSQFAVT